MPPFYVRPYVKMHKAGVNIAMGTDTTMDPNMGENAMELQLYVEHGMTPMEAIKTATCQAAAAVGLDEKLGTLEAGQLGDVIAVEGDVIADIGILQRKENIRLVAKEGAVYIDTLSPMHKYVIHPDPGSIKIVDTE